MSGRVLLTGGGGFIGRQLVAGLVRRQYYVTVLDRAAATGREQAGVEWIRGDTQRWDDVTRCIEGKDYVIHLAAGSNFLMYEQAPVPQTSGAIVGFHNVLEAARRHGIRKIVYASTSAVYEGNQVPYAEGAPLHPPDLKAFAKKVNEAMAQLYSDRFGISAVGLRPFSVYGPGEIAKGAYANIVSLFTWAMLANRRPIVWGDGRQTRDFIYVEDMVEAVLLALCADIHTQEINVGTGVEISFNEVIGIINETLGTELQPIYVPVPISIYARRLLADTSRASHILGFRPCVGLREGVRRVVESARLLPEHDRARLADMQERAQELAQAAREGVVT